MTERNFGRATNSFIAEVADVNDPHQAGRVRIRIYGRHDDKTNIPDSSLPFAQVIQPVTSAANGRMGTAPVGLTVGSKVIGMWIDADQQLPVILGSVGRAGDPIPGQTVNGAPAVNIETGSIPGSSQGVAANPYTVLNGNRVSIADIDSRQANVTSVPVNTGTVITEAVEDGMQFPNAPTTGSAEASETNVLQILRRVDPTSSISALPCLPSNALQLQIQIDLGSIAAGLINTVTNAVINALLQLADSLGITQVLNAIQSAANGIANFSDALKALASGGLCGAPRPLASINAGTQALARSYSSLQKAAAQAGNAPNAIRAALGTATGTIISNVPSALFRPIQVSPTIPVGFVQEYYAADADPYPGYIKWIDPNNPDTEPVFALRDGQPNFSSASQHVEYDVTQVAIGALRSAITGGNSAQALTAAMDQIVGVGQVQGMIRSMGNGFNPSSVAGMAALAAKLAPTILSAVQGNFQARISVSVLPNASALNNAATKFTRLQTSLEMRRARLETAMRRI